MAENMLTSNNILDLDKLLNIFLINKNGGVGGSTLFQNMYIFKLIKFKKIKKKIGSKIFCAMLYKKILQKYFEKK